MKQLTEPVHILGIRLLFLPYITQRLPPVPRAAKHPVTKQHLARMIVEGQITVSVKSN